MDLAAAVQSVFKELGDGKAYPEILHEAVAGLLNAIQRWREGVCTPSKPKTIHRYKQLCRRQGLCGRAASKTKRSVIPADASLPVLNRRQVQTN